MITWDNRYAIGVAEIDAQHRELFGRVASFQAALDRGDHAEISSTFAFLREYALVHFADEERLMLGAGYPRVDEHRATHLAFVHRLRALTLEHEERGPTALLGLRARNWIVVWLVDHVGGDDVALGRHLRSCAA